MLERIDRIDNSHAPTAYKENTIMRLVAVFTFVLVVGVCSYVLLNPVSYSTPVLCLAGFVLCVAACAVASSLENLPFDPVSKPAQATRRFGLRSGLDPATL